MSDAGTLHLRFTSDDRLFKCPKEHVQQGEFFITAALVGKPVEAYSGPMCRRCYVEGLGLMFRTVLIEKPEAKE